MEYIEREALLDAYDAAHKGEPGGARKLIAEAPAADVAPVVHGRWVLEREPDGKPYCFHCSVCDGDFHHIGITVAYDYCPNCGARMDGE